MNKYDQQLLIDNVHYIRNNVEIGSLIETYNPKIVKILVISHLLSLYFYRMNDHISFEMDVRHEAILFLLILEILQMFYFIKL